MPAAINPRVRARYLQLRREGFTLRQAASECGVSVSWAKKYEGRADELTKAGLHQLRAEERMRGPIPYGELCVEAKRAWDDFEFFRRRYMGHLSTPWQLETAAQMIALLESPDKEFVVENVAPGGGKALALDTPIPTPSGWSTMKDLQVGDVVFDETGSPCRVTFKSDVFYGHDCFEVASDDGTSLIADADHLWRVRLGGHGQYGEWRRKPDRVGKSGPKPSPDGRQLHTTAALARRRGKRPQLQMAGALQLPDADLPLDPYLLGVWLGDGHSAAARVTCHRDDAAHYVAEFAKVGVTVTRSSQPTSELLQLTRHRGLCGRGHERERSRNCERCANLVFRSRHYGEPMPPMTHLSVSGELRRMGLLGNKHVPERYLRASAAQRLALLQGLVDTDGHVTPDGRVEFTSTNRRLAEAVRHLAHSLGVKASMSEGRATLDGRDCGPKWRVTFMMAGAARLPRKAERCRDGVRTPHRYLTITPVPSVPTQCIQVDSPSHLYLAGEGMLVTHNTTLVHDLACWVTVRNRRIRGLIGSASSQNAARMLARVKRSLERVSPVRANPDLIARGLAVDAESCLARDFGLFKPVQRDLWTRGEFIVAQSDDDGAITEKEPTWSSFGFDATFLGNRFDIAFWDDVVDKKRARTVETRDQMIDVWDTECETRLEPSGLFMLIGQRLAHDDLYRYCLDKTADTGDSDDEDGDAGGAAEAPPMYRHIVFKAHYPELCAPGTHRRDAKPWPEGCLLDPVRLPWRELAPKMNRPDLFRTVYQQEDGDPASAWVPKLWITGGTDPATKELHFGCLDHDRTVGQVPKGLAGPLFSVGTVDPSGERYWAVQWWIFAPNAANQAFLIDCVRQKMAANELLDWNANSGQFYGLMHDWQARSKKLGAPIRHWVVEINAAQRYLLAYQHMKRWTAAESVKILPHSTTARKLDPEFGPDILRDHFRFGRIRLPYSPGDPARTRVLAYIDEIAKYPRGRYDDQVMATWFPFANLPRLTVAHTELEPAHRPALVGRLPDARALIAVR